jgi:hypothetical protein
LEKIKGWLQGNGATEITVHPSDEFITATFTVEQAEVLLSTKYFVYQHLATGNLEVVFYQLQANYSLKLQKPILSQRKFLKL